MTANVINVQMYGINEIEYKFIDESLEDYAQNSPKIANMCRATNFKFSLYDDLLKQEYDNTDNYYENGTYLGIDENYIDFNRNSLDESKVIYGRLLSRKDIINRIPYIMLRKDTAKRLFGKENAVNEKLTIGNNEFTVIGILEYKESDFYVNPENAYISYYYARDYMDMTDGYLTYYFSPAMNDYSNDIKGELKKILGDYIENYYIYSTAIEMILENMENLIGIITLVFIAIAGLSIVVGGIGIMNIMLVSVSERIKETGIRMALGAKNSDIVIQFLIEGIILTILSGIIGIGLAEILTFIANMAIKAQTSYDFALSIDLYTMAKIIAFCGLIGIIFGIYPALKAGKLDPVEALKYE